MVSKVAVVSLVTKVVRVGVETRVGLKEKDSVRKGGITKEVSPRGDFLEKARDS